MHSKGASLSWLYCDNSYIASSASDVSSLLVCTAIHPQITRRHCRLVIRVVCSEGSHPSKISTASTLVSMLTRPFLFLDSRSQTHETNSTELVAEEHWLFRTLHPGWRLVLYSDNIIIKQFSRDIYCPPACLLGVFDIFFLAMPLYSSKDDKCNLEHFLQSQKS